MIDKHEDEKMQDDKNRRVGINKRTTILLLVAATKRSRAVLFVPFLSPLFSNSVEQIHKSKYIQTHNVVLCWPKMMSCSEKRAAVVDKNASTRKE